jgi:hypothetical protein
MLDLRVEECRKGGAIFLDGSMHPFDSAAADD